MSDADRKRLIILDTESSGLSPEEGDRLVEIACLEIIDFVPTGAVFHSYFNPQVAISKEASRIIGYSNERLVGKPLFVQKADELLAFIGDSLLVIHGAVFARSFLTSELNRCGKSVIPDDRYVCTLEMARRLFPEKRANLLDLYNRLFPWKHRNDLGSILDDAGLVSQVFPVLRKYSFDLALHPERREASDWCNSMVSACSPLGLAGGRLPL